MAVIPGLGLDCRLEGVEGFLDCPIADGMDCHLEAISLGLDDSPNEFIWTYSEYSFGRRIVFIRLGENGRPSPHGSINEYLGGSNP